MEPRDEGILMVFYVHQWMIIPVKTGARGIVTNVGKKNSEAIPGKRSV
jgi:hypothetical protein